MKTMNEQDIAKLIHTIKSLGIVDSPDVSIPMPMQCQVLPPQPWDKKTLEDSLAITLPSAIINLWNQTSGLRLFENINYGQWGLIFWSPNQIINEQEKRIAQRKEDFRPGDLIIGELLGDADLLVLRCDEISPDFGNIIIALPLDSREEWNIASLTLESFLNQLIAANGDKFWENPTQLTA
jgi:hypothetical protein